ncbi:TPA: HNH endonuclease [Burkholderia orbicola]|uniref:HNH endonuclease n=1 Tax=Burkholderia cenocepacia TaxID=95486 RepID=UPI000F5B3856|nr:HNH endonuclease [Burkholderia cenocepacia]
MIKLEPPELVAGDVFTLCISRVRDAGFKERLASISTNVADASDTFQDLAARVCLHEFVREAVIGGVVTTSEMESVYTKRMVPKTSPGRAVYDTLMSLAPAGKCPLCAQRDASTLDHHLPKAHYPVLAVTPLNLVPSCKDCNKAKLAKLPGNANEEALHPYFDDIDNDRWLFASVHTTVPASLRFFVDPPDHWDDVLTARMFSHFETLALGTLYAAQGADELLNIRHQLRIIYDAGGAATVRTELLARAESARDVRVNGWRVSAFEAFAQSDWFCDGGFMAA